MQELVCLSTNILLVIECRRTFLFFCVFLVQLECLTQFILVCDKFHSAMVE